MKRLSKEAKQAIVEKALDRQGRSLLEIAHSHNIGYSTLQKWIRNYRDNISTNTQAKSSAPNKPLSKAERFQHLASTAQLDEAAIGVYCRERGLFSFQLQQWKEEFMSSDEKPNKQNQQAELKALRAENKLLKRDLKRKDRALAETAALLILKKKADLIWGEVEDD